jgi:hypothetical protein
MRSLRVFPPGSKLWAEFGARGRGAATRRPVESGGIPSCWLGTAAHRGAHTASPQDCCGTEWTVREPITFHGAAHTPPRPCALRLARANRGVRAARAPLTLAAPPRVATPAGIGLHSGEETSITISSAPAGSGVTFLLPPARGRGAERAVPASWEGVVSTTLSTVMASEPPALGGRPRQRAGFLLQQAGAALSLSPLSSLGRALTGGTVATVEHLLAALAGAGVDCAAVRVAGGEVPPRPAS